MSKGVAPRVSGRGGRVGGLGRRGASISGGEWGRVGGLEA